MKNYKLIATMTFAIACSVWITSCELEDMNDITQPYVQNPKEIESEDPGPVFGDSENQLLSEWTKEWWKFTLNLDCAFNPLNFQSMPTVSSQPGPVVFLIGSDKGFATRNIVVSAQQAILVPVMNTIQFYSCIAPETRPVGVSTNLLKSAADRLMDQATNMKAVLDGVTIRIANEHRAATGNFYLKGNRDLLNCLDYCLIGDEQIAAADGYWLFLKGLSVGKHHLRIHGEILQTGIVVDAYYNITVLETY